MTNENVKAVLEEIRPALESGRWRCRACGVKMVLLASG
jgi:hypothetical protein